MKKLILSIIYLCWGSLYSQSISPEIISTVGGFYSNASGMISFTGGEPIGEMASSSGNMITQGFEQPDISVVSVKNIALASPHLIVYPNPFSEQAVILSDLSFSSAALTLINVLGQTVATINNIRGNSIIIQRNTLAPGIYFASITQNNQVITKIKLIIF